MGYYINFDSKGRDLPHKKAQALIDDGAKEVSGEEFLENLICVVNNGAFEAAGFAYSKEEYDHFKAPDSGPQRGRRWLVHPKAAELAGYKPKPQ